MTEKESNDSVCGPGSLFRNTEAARSAIIAWLEKYEIKRLVDAGAGDVFWIRHLYPEFDRLGVTYQAFDKAVLAPEVQELDYTNVQLPECDAILCRHSLNHNDAADVVRALGLFRKSARFLIATQFERSQATSGKAPSFICWNLAVAPFDLGEPLELVKDAKHTSLALWRLQ